MVGWLAAMLPDGACAAWLPPLLGCLAQPRGSCKLATWHLPFTEIRDPWTCRGGPYTLTYQPWELGHVDLPRDEWEVAVASNHANGPSQVTKWPNPVATGELRPWWAGAGHRQ